MARALGGDFESICVLAKQLGLDIWVRKFPVDTPESLDGDLLAINRDLGPRDRLWYAAHGLAHFLMHCGDQDWLIEAGYDVVVAKQEEQANRFAAFSIAPTLRELWKLPPERRAYRVRLEQICGLRAA